MKQGKLLAVTILAVILIAVIVIDLRPTRGLKLLFFRYYHLEQLNKFTSVFNPILALFYRPTAPLQQIDIQVSQLDVATMVGSLPKPYPAVFLSREAAPEVPARVTIDGRQYEAKVKIRGKSPRHWQDQQKSLRLDIMSNQPPSGISTLHLVIPWLMRDPIKLHSNLRVWWMIREREQFMKRHWELLASVLGVEK